MKAKEYLKDIARMEAHIGAKEQRVAALKEIASSPSSPKYDGMPRNPNKGGSPMADAVMRYMDLEREIEKDKKVLEEKKVFMLSLIGELDSTEHQTVLIKRYFDKKSWIDIKEELFYSLSWTQSLHGRALVELDRMLENESS